MGNDQTTLKPKDTNRLQVSKFLEVSAKYNKTVYNRNKKPFKQFQSIIKSIHLRSTYLKYDWIEWLCHQLDKDPQIMYRHYCEMCKLTVIKQTQKCQYFHLNNLFSIFLSSFENKAKNLEKSPLSNTDLESLFEEAKSYFMVENWFAQLRLISDSWNSKATLISYESSKQNINSEKMMQFPQMRKKKVIEKEHQREKIYRILTKLTERYFDNNYIEMQLKDQGKLNQKIKLTPISFFNTKQTSLIKLIARQSDFKKRQTIISQLFDILFKNNKNEVQNNQGFVIDRTKITALTKIFGLKKVFSILKVLSELGQIEQVQKINSILKFIFQMMMPINTLNNQEKTSPTKKINPYKVPKSNHKIKTQSIR